MKELSTQPPSSQSQSQPPPSQLIPLVTIASAITGIKGLEIEMLSEGLNRINRYVEVDGISLYIRLTSRYLAGKYHSTLDIAKIIIDEELRGQLLFVRLLASLIKEFPDRTIYIENIFETRLVDHFRKRKDWEVIEVVNAVKGEPLCAYHTGFDNKAKLDNKA